MNTALLILQIILSVILITVILLQSQGSGLGATWGGGGESYHTKRGVEKVLLYVTAIVIAIFGVVAILNGIVL